MIACRKLEARLLFLRRDVEDEHLVAGRAGHEHRHPVLRGHDPVRASLRPESGRTASADRPSRRMRRPCCAPVVGPDFFAVIADGDAVGVPVGARRLLVRRQLEGRLRDHFARRGVDHQEAHETVHVHVDPFAVGAHDRRSGPIAHGNRPDDLMVLRDVDHGDLVRLRPGQSQRRPPPMAGAALDRKQIREVSLGIDQRVVSDPERVDVGDDLLLLRIEHIPVPAYDG